MADHGSSGRPLVRDRALRGRAEAVIPGGMFGHQDVRYLPAEFPQFMARGDGARVWDVDGNEYVDLLCSYGPVVLGHRHPHVEEAVAAQMRLADCQNGPSPQLVDLAEELVRTVSHADWALFQKNGTDATTLCCTIARAHSGRARILVAKGAYHGAAPWATPRLAGVTAADRANLGTFTYNDLDSVRQAIAEAGDDLAGIMVSPFRHDAGYDQEIVNVAFARGLRRLCDETGAALILDDVRCGFRLHLGGSWEPIGVEPDLSAWSKAIANGYPIAAVLGAEAYREAARSVFATGSFWCSAVPMAAALATLEALRAERGVERMQEQGSELRRGIAAQAEGWGFEIRQTGPVQMPYLSFDGDERYRLVDRFCAEALVRGAFLHPRHNWFVSAAMTDDDVQLVLSATDGAFGALRKHLAS